MDNNAWTGNFMNISQICYIKSMNRTQRQWNKKWKNKKVKKVKIKDNHLFLMLPKYNFSLNKINK